MIIRVNKNTNTNSRKYLLLAIKYFFCKYEFKEICSINIKFNKINMGWVSVFLITPGINGK
jgi:hypothetical protein